MWKLPDDSSKHPCIVVAYAMACEVSVRGFIRRLKDRGGPVVGTYHLQQCADVALDLGYVSFPIEVKPQLIPSPVYKGPAAQVKFPEGHQQRFRNYLNLFRGVLGGVCKTSSGLIGHAAAWDCSLIWDPRGSAYNFPDATKPPHEFHINNFIALLRMESQDA